MYIYVYMCIYIYIYIHMYVHMYVCIYPFSRCRPDGGLLHLLHLPREALHRDQEVFLRADRYVYTGVGMCINVYIYIYIYMCIHVYIHIYIYIQYIILYDVISLHYCIIHEGSVEYTIEHVLSEISNPRKPYPSVVHTGTGTLRPVIVSLDPRIPTDSANLSLQRYSTMTDESGPSPGRFEQSKGMLCISCVAVLKLWIHRGRSAHRLSVAILGSKPV